MDDGPQARITTRREQLTSALPVVHEALTAAGVWHCLAFGTLLGAARDGEVIEWDHDLDMWVRPADAAAIEAISGRGRVEFRRRRLEGRSLAVNPGRVASFDPGLWTILVDSSTVGELWAPTLFADGVLRHYDLGTGVYFWPQSSMPHHAFEQLGEAQMAGRPYPAPADPQALLERLYGEDWRTPRRAPADGGEPRPGHGYSGDRADARLGDWVADCERAGWDRRRYGGQPSWPRPIAGAGPPGSAERARHLSGSEWWRTIEELHADY